MDELKNCPFCGRKAIHESWETDKMILFGTGWVGCRACRCFMNYVNGERGRRLAFEAWNRRV